MILLLIAILFLLILFIGGDRGVDAFWTLLWNFVVFVITVILLAKGFNIFVVTIVSCVIISLVTLFFQNGSNIKTLTAFISVMLIVISLIIMVLFIGTRAGIQGFGSEYTDVNASYGYYGDININMTDIAISVVILGLMGAILDTALSISSATFEVYNNNKHLTYKELFKSSMNIGKDILGTTINTLFFIFAGESLTLMILFKEHYSFSSMMNSKVFCQETIQIFFSTIGCILIIPATALISSYGITKIHSTESDNK